MPPALNVIALISGGKDSLYSLLHCIQNGHNVIALANLYPPPSPPSELLNADPSKTADAVEGPDLNSFMYQTVGHSLIPLYATALQLPLYRHQITGSATQTGRYYDPTLLAATVSDETEDLVPLLRDVVRNHPEANAVSSGAILSTYQRTRIESVSLRLGLTPVSFLWQYPALPPPPAVGGGKGRGESLTGLLDDMAAAGCEARIVKVASGGVGEEMLWADVTSEKVRRALVNGMAPFCEGQEFWLRGAVLGEGGEYETLAMGGPARVWKGGRIEVSGTEVVREEGGVSWVRVKGARVVERLQGEVEGTRKEELVTVPGMLDEQFQATLKNTRISSSMDDDLERPATMLIQVPRSEGRTYTFSSLPQSHNLNNHAKVLQISNLVSPGISSIAVQTETILERLRTILHSLGLNITHSITHIVSTTLLLRSINDFVSVNEVYATLFPPGMPSPPARVAVACGDCLPEGVDVSLSVMLDLGDRQRWRGLHVQGRSYWAPANIGAYSQAIAVGLVTGGADRSGESVYHGFEVVHVAGQIPLVPASMEMYSGSFAEQAVLALQHLWRVGQEREVDAWCWGVAYLGRVQGELNNTIKVLERVQTAWDSWRAAHEVRKEPALQEGDDGGDDGYQDLSVPQELDAWDLKHNRSAGFGFDLSKVTVGEHLHVLPQWNVIVRAGTAAGNGSRGYQQSLLPPLIVAEVQALPRNAPIEWHSLGLGGLAKSSGERIQGNGTLVRTAWGAVSWVSIPCPNENGRNYHEEHGADENDERRSKEKAKAREEVGEVTFVTIMVFAGQHSSAEENSDRRAPRVLDILNTILKCDVQAHTPHGQKDRDPAATRVIYSTSYISTSSNGRDWEAVEIEQALPGTTVIPSWRVWGFVDEASKDANAQDASLKEEMDEGGAVHGAIELSMSITIRVDVGSTPDH